MALTSKITIITKIKIQCWTCTLDQSHPYEIYVKISRKRIKRVKRYTGQVKRWQARDQNKRKLVIVWFVEDLQCAKLNR